jgi:hypothetical protein
MPLDTEILTVNEVSELLKILRHGPLHGLSVAGSR